MIPLIQNIKEFYKRNEKVVLLGAAFACVFWLGFFAGKVNSWQSAEPIIQIMQYPNQSSILRESVQSEQVLGQTSNNSASCKIKGNVSSSGKIYHIPGGSFYNRTQPEMCFNTEAEAVAAGFRKSSR